MTATRTPETMASPMSDSRRSTTDGMFGFIERKQNAKVIVTEGLFVCKGMRLCVISRQSMNSHLESKPLWWSWNCSFNSHSAGESSCAMSLGKDGQRVEPREAKRNVIVTEVKERCRDKSAT